MDTITWASESDINAAGCGYPEIPGYERTWIDKLSYMLPSKRKIKNVKNGIVLGLDPYNNDVLMHDGVENVLVIGSPRSGKKVNTVFPTTLLWQRSFFSFEQYRDLWDNTAVYRKNKFGQRVLKFSPLCEDSAKWNPLGEVRLWLGPEAVSSDIRVIADSVICCTGTGLPLIDPLHQQASSLLAAIIVYLFAAVDYRGIPCMYDVWKFVSDNDAEKIFSLLQSTYPIPESCPKASSFLKNEELPLDDVIAVIKEALEPYCNSRVDQNTRSSDFRLTELFDSDEPLSVYYCLDGQWDYRGIANLFVNMLFYKISLSSITKDLESKCLVMLDDARELSYLPQIESAFATSTVHGVRLCLVVQNKTQLNDLFGLEHQIAQYFGILIHLPDFIHESIQWILDTFDSSISPDILNGFDMNKLLVLIRGHKPILAKKLLYFKCPFFTSNLA